MTNFEFYKDQILEICKKGEFVALFQGKPTSCTNISCYECDFEHGKNDNVHCRANFTKWLYATHNKKPALNKYERALCEALQTGWIARAENDSLLWFHRRKPIKNEQYREWQNHGFFDYITFLEKRNPEINFGFIKWEDDEPWSVEDLLKLEVKG